MFNEAHPHVELFTVALMEPARVQQVRMIELRAATRLASLWVLTENAGKAVEILSPLYDSFTEGFNTPDLRSAKELLDQLS
ncbi:hypothetical protein N8198_03255 [Gammaproteobacteria bacterium]|nr:hypothetical protein [Gammaproteobacteria bacterium]